MSLQRLTLALVAALLAVQLAATAPASAQAIITNGTVTVGVNPHGQLNVPGPASPIVGTPLVGLRYNANQWEALSHARPCEGWGAAVASLGTTGWADECFGAPDGPVFNLTLQDFTSTADSATSVVTIPGPGGADVLSVSHEWVPSFWPNLYQANVRIRNLTGGTLGSGAGDIRYRRVMDWDIEPTVGSEYVTIGGMAPAVRPPWVRFTSDDGFEVPDPLRFADVSVLYPPGSPVDVYADTQAVFGVPSPVPCGFTDDFTNCGRFIDATGAPIVVDHGALFDFAFPAFTMPGEERDFAIFYGAAPSRADAEMALFQVGAEVYSLAECNPLEPGGSGSPLCDLTDGTPVTFIFGAAGLGGNPAFGDVTVYAFQDTNGNGLFDFVDTNNSGLCDPGEATDAGVAGVALTLSGADLHGNPVSRTGVSAAGCGLFDFPVLPAGHYTVTAADPAGGYKLAGTAVNGVAGAAASAVTVDVGGPSTFLEIDFRYVTGSIAGTAYADANGDDAFDAGDTGLPGLSVALDGTDATGAPVHRTTTTAADGTYAFATLLGGTYTLSAPAATSAGLPADTPSAVVVALGAGDNHTKTDFGYCTASATALTSSANPSLFGAPVTFTAKVTACGGAVAAGTVTFTDGAATLGAVAVGAGGQAALSTSTLAAGGHVVTATYASGAALGGSSAQLTQTVSPAATATTVTSSANPSTFGQAVAFTATVTSGAGPVGAGSVTFKDNGVALGAAVAVNAGGQATLTVSTLAGGAHPITAEYSGVPSFAPSAGSLTQTVNPLATTTGVVSSLDPSNVGEAVSFTATVGSALGAVTAGTVTFADGGTSLGSVAVDAGGHAVLTTSALAAGNHSVTAAYAGTPSFSPSQGGVLQAVSVPVTSGETCLVLDFREITYFRDRKVLTSSDDGIRSRNHISGPFDPSRWPYDPHGGRERTRSRGTLFRVYGFAASSLGQSVPNADTPSIRYVVQADPAIPGAYFIDLGGPARVLICPSQLQTALIDGTRPQPWTLPGTTTLGDAQRNVPGVMLSHNVGRIPIPARVRNALRAAGLPQAGEGLVDYVAVQQWGHGNEEFREFVDVQVEILADGLAGFHTVGSRDVDGSVSCNYLDSNPERDGLRLRDVWAGTHPQWGAACGTREPAANQAVRENYAMPANGVQLLSTVAEREDTLRVYYGPIRSVR